MSASTDNRDALGAEVLRLHQFGVSIRMIAKKLNLARKTVCALLGDQPRAARFRCRACGVGDSDSRDARRPLRLVLSR